MKVLKVVALVVALGLLLWFLNPQRAIMPNEPGVVEINYTGDAGANGPVRR